jgi:hypothetical protein
MSKIILDSDLKAKLNGLNEQFEVCDPDGRVLGRFLPEGVYRQLLYRLAEAQCPYTPDELEAMRAETGGQTLADFWRGLGKA